MITSPPESRIDPVYRMQAAYELLKEEAEVLVYVHSDVEIQDEEWVARILAEFQADPLVGVVGFGGAIGIGRDDIYRTPYHLLQLIRLAYRSNTTDAENHGDRFTGDCDVATLDGFCLAVRRSVLDKSNVQENDGMSGGWPTLSLPFHNYDNWICLRAQQLGYKVRMVGVRCTHFGGGHSTKKAWQEAAVRDFGKTDAEIHRDSHLYLYEQFRDILPVRVTGGVTGGVTP
jgi:GT2 family glycosyltransferase